MSDPRAELESTLRAIDQMPWGPAERELVAQAVSAAVDLGDPVLEYQARMRQTASANMAGDTDLTLSSFAWCLAKYDEDPHRFPADLGGGVDLLWHFKWMAGSLRCSPAFSLTQINAVLDDMEAHYRAAGLGSSGVLMARFESAWATGQRDEADRLREELERTPRDSHSHCEACTRSQIAGFFAETGRDADALRLVDELIEGDLACAEEPAHALARSLLPALRSGRTEAARAAHLRSYRLTKDDPDSLSIVAANIVFAAVTGNEARALSMVERHLGWLGHDGLNDAGHFRALCAFALALDAVSRAGHGDTVVRGADAKTLHRFFGEAPAGWQAAALADAAWAAAGSLADAFDRRNGNDAFARALADSRALTETVYDVPIRPDTVAALPAPAPTTPQDRYDRAIALADWGDPGGGLVAANAALEDGVTAHEAQLRGVVVGALAAQEEWERAEAALPARIAALRAAGNDGQAEVETNLGLALYGRFSEADGSALEAAASAPGHAPTTMGDLYLALAGIGVRIDDLPAAISLAVAGADFLLEAGRPERAASALAFAAALQLAGDAPDVRETIERALALPEASAGARARALQVRARLAGRAEAFAEGAADADEATRLALLFGPTTGMTELCTLAAALTSDAGDPAGAVARFRVAAQVADREGQPAALTIRYRLGTALLQAGDPAEAADVLADVLDAEDAAGVSPGSRGQTASALAQAHEAEGELLQAARTWDYAASLFDHAGDRSQHAEALTHLGRCLGRGGMHESAAAALAAAVQALRDAQAESHLLWNAVHLHAQSAAMAEDPAAADILTEALHLAEAMESPWAVADVTDTQAQLLARAGDVDAAVATALNAADAYVRAEDAAAGARSELFAAQLLASVGRGADSVPLYRAALEHSEDHELRQVAAIEFGDVLAELGRHAESAEVRLIADA